MTRLSIFTACVLMLGACASTRPDLTDWAGFVNEVEGLPPEELETRIATVVRSFRDAPDDATRLRLAYLLALPGPATQDLDASLVLLGEIATDGRYLALRDLVTRQVELADELRLARQTIDKRTSQVRALQQRVDELETQVGQQSEDRRQAELQALRSRVAELQAQLEALKSIETEMSEDQKAIDDLPNE